MQTPWHLLLDRVTIGKRVQTTVSANTTYSFRTLYNDVVCRVDRGHSEEIMGTDRKTYRHRTVTFGLSQDIQPDYWMYFEGERWWCRGEPEQVRGAYKIATFERPEKVEQLL